MKGEREEAEKWAQGGRDRSLGTRVAKKKERERNREQRKSREVGKAQPL